MEKFFLETTSGKIAVKQTRSDGFPVVLIHGNSLSSLTFENQINSAELEEFRLIAPDLPGHGDSGKSIDPENVYSPLNFIRVIVELCLKLDAANGILAGHSLGGHMIISALKSLPEVNGALVFGTPPLGVPPRMDLAFQPVPALGLAFKPDLTEDELMLLASVFVKPGITPPASIVSSIRATDPSVRNIVGKALVSGQGNDEAERIRNFGKPFAILHGAEDQLVNKDYINGFQSDNLWRNTIHSIINAGHTPQIEQPEVFNSFLLKFLKDIQP